jgi:hypothetical protein
MILCPRDKIELEYNEEDDVYECPECLYTVPADLVHEDDEDEEE